MRFNNRITFVTQESYYDPSIGEYVDTEPIKETKPCKLSSLGLNRRKELFGELNEHITVARLQHPYKATFDYVELDNQRYRLKEISDYRKGVLFLVGDDFANKN